MRRLFPAASFARSGQACCFCSPYLHPPLSFLLLTVVHDNSLVAFRLCVVFQRTDCRSCLVCTIIIITIATSCTGRRLARKRPSEANQIGSEQEPLTRANLHRLRAATSWPARPRPQLQWRTDSLTTRIMVRQPLDRIQCRTSRHKSLPPHFSTPCTLHTSQANHIRWRPVQVW